MESSSTRQHVSQQDPRDKPLARLLLPCFGEALRHDQLLTGLPELAFQGLCMTKIPQVIQAVVDVLEHLVRFIRVEAFTFKKLPNLLQLVQDAWAIAGLPQNASGPHGRAIHKQQQQTRRSVQHPLPQAALWGSESS